MANILLIFLILSAVGGLCIGIVNRKGKQRSAWIKYVVYLLIISVLFTSVLFVPMLFRMLCFLIVSGGGVELFRLQHDGRKISSSRFYFFVSIYVIMGVLFCLFGYQASDTILFTLLIVCSFDAFSQLSGQMLGRHRICPNISPNKTLEGTVGGTAISLTVSIVVGQSMDWSIGHSLLLGLGIAMMSFAGDLSASYVKRQYGVKDFGHIFPEHGGFLDRFDSLICAGAFVFLFQTIIV